MKFVTVTYNQTELVGIMSEDRQFVIPLNKLSEKVNDDLIFPEKMIDCIKEDQFFFEKASKLYEQAKRLNIISEIKIKMTDLKLLAPIPRPAKNIICIGKNYADHAIEMGGNAAVPTNLIVFTKAPTTVIGHQTEIENHHNLTSQLDYEGELAIIIGKSGRDIEETAAYEHIFGYTIINDITARDLQEKHNQFFLGKSLDTSCPMGPWIVHKSALANYRSLAIETRVNGEVRQKSTTDQFIFSIENIIAQLSKGMTLEPGDIIATGTPAGVGKGFTPPKFLRPKDEIAITISGIGTLINKIAE